MVFITVALMIFFMVRTDLFNGRKDGKNMIEQGIDAEKSAQAAKDMIELNNRTTMQQLQ